MEQKSPAAKKSTKKPTKRLLLADDSMTIQKVVNLTFAGEGIEVVAVGDGNALMEKFVEATPDLVMVDLNMPGADGYKICEIIKHDEETKHIPVILLVGSFEPFDEMEAKRVGADDFLTKPFQSINQLVDKVSALLDPNYSGASTSSFAGDGNRVGEERFLPAAGKAENLQNDDSEIAAAFRSNEFNKNFVAAPQLADSNADVAPIQTNQIASLPADEAKRFYADFPDENSRETAPLDEINLIEMPRGNRTVSAEDRIRIKDSGGARIEPSDTSPEFVDRIAARVVEKLSGKIIEELVRQIAPQMSELIALEVERQQNRKDN